MQPLRMPANKISTRARVFDIIRERSFRTGDFTLASGRKSKFYLDLKPTMFHPQGAHGLAELIVQRIADLKVDYVGGLEMGAVPLVAAVNTLSGASERPVAGFFVRKRVKDHGTKKLVEATDNLQGKNVVILEDVTTSGGSAMDAVRAAREAGGAVLLVLSVVDRNEGAAAFFADAGIAFDWLFQLDEFASAAEKN